MTRCAACKCLRRRCPSDCIFSPYFPANNPQRFACVHRIYGASHIERMLQQLPIHLRTEAANSLYYEARCRIYNPVYGCVGIISQLHQEISNAQSQLAQAQAEIAFLHSRHYSSGNQQNYEQVEAPPSLLNTTTTATATTTVTTTLLEENGVGRQMEGSSTPWFY